LHKENVKNNIKQIKEGKEEPEKQKQQPKYALLALPEPDPSVRKYG
jgi:hypothetical protein